MRRRHAGSTAGSTAVVRRPGESPGADEEVRDPFQEAHGESVELDDIPADTLRQLVADGI